MAANDALARGAKSVTFPSNSHVDQTKWDLAFKDVPEKNTNKNESKRPRRKSA